MPQVLHKLTPFEKQRQFGFELDPLIVVEVEVVIYEQGSLLGFKLLAAEHSALRMLKKFSAGALS